jgi:hypothetical protein
MHAEIKKFWEDSGYAVETDVLLDDGEGPWRLFWFIKGEKEIRCVGMSDFLPRGLKVSDPKPQCTAHIFDGETYSEEEMLRIIGLKAFV